VLLGERSKLAALFRELGLESVEPDFIVPRIGRNGPEVHDIRTREENIAYANRLTSLIEELARQRDTCLHVSLAGGRKTMSSYAHAAISLFGRAQDELSHILVEPKAFETARSAFMWPGQRPEVVIDQNGTRYSSDDARVILVRSPFVPLGDYLRRHPFPKGDIDYARMIAHAKAALAEPQLVLDVSNCTVAFGGKTVGLGDQEFAFLRVLAAAKLEGWPGFGPGGAGDNQGGWVAYKQFLDPSSTAYARFFDYWRDCSPGIPSDLCDTFKQALDALIRKIEDASVAPSIRKAHRQAAQDMFKSVKKRVLDKLGREYGAARQILPDIARFQHGGGKGSCVGIHIEPYAITIRPRGGGAG
jgi:CRISPR-associated protein (TIGR02584 family)